MTDFETCQSGTMRKLTETDIALEGAKQLLRAAKCPNAHCVDGVIQEGYGDGYETFECQFCHDRNNLLASGE